MTDNFKQNALVIMTLVAVSVMLLQLFLQVRESKVEIELMIQSVERISTKLDVSDLTARFEFKGTPVQELSVVRVLVSNSGNTTLIGKGARTGIIDDSILIGLGDGLRLLDFDTFRNEVAGTLHINERGFEIAFDQWRPSEVIGVSLYIESAQAGNADLFQVENRDLINGDLIVTDRTEQFLSNNPLFRLFGPDVATLLKGFGVVLWATCFLLIVFTLVISPIERIRMLRWQRTQRRDFDRFIKASISVFDEDDYQAALRNPHGMEDIILSKYQGDKPPATLTSRLRYDLAVYAIVLVLGLGVIATGVGLFMLY